jgi:hypothetical protein
MFQSCHKSAPIDSPATAAPHLDRGFRSKIDHELGVESWNDIHSQSLTVQCCFSVVTMCYAQCAHLVDTSEEHGHIVGLPRAKLMQRKGRASLGSTLGVNEPINLAVGVTCEVCQRGTDGGLLLQTVDRHQGEQLVDCPRIHCRPKHCRGIQPR